MTQKILIAKPTWTDAYCTTYAKREGCCAYYKGVPPCYEVQAQEEGWTLPHIVVEEVPDAGA